MNTSTVPITDIQPNPDQPRQEFDQQALEGLADSLRIHGLIQPIVVTQTPSGYIIVDGERRWRAAQMAGLKTLPVYVRDVNGALFENALVANLQREDLNPIEEGRAYQLLYDEGLPVAAISRRVGVSAPRIQSRMLWLKLEPEIQILVARGTLPVSADVANALLSIEDVPARVELARQAAKNRLTIKGILNAATRLLAVLDSQAYRGDEPPMLAYGRQAKRPVSWNMLDQLALEEDELPDWKFVRQAARKVCDACELRDMANKTICAPCPGVQMVAELIKIHREKLRE